VFLNVVLFWELCKKLATSRLHGRVATAKVKWREGLIFGAQSSAKITKRDVIIG